MRRVPVSELLPGMILGRTLFADNNLVLLAAGQKLTDSYIKRIAELGTLTVFVEEPGFESVIPETAILEATRLFAERSVQTGFENLTHALQLESDAEFVTREVLESNPRLFRLPNLSEMSHAVSSIVRDVIDQNRTLIDLFAERTHSTYVYRHAVSSTVLAVLIGRRFAYTGRQLRELALGCLLHDIGKTCMPNIIDSPEYVLDQEELESFHEHPSFGAILLENTAPDLHAERYTVLHHHEWQNGQGFPQGLKGDNKPPTRTGENPNNTIYRYAEIVAVAEAFDNMLNGTGELPVALSPADALGTILSFAGRRFNSSICQQFSQIVALYPTGSMVQIIDTQTFGLIGYFAVVKEQGAELSRPAVILYADPNGNRVKPITIDFSRDDMLQMKLIA